MALNLGRSNAGDGLVVTDYLRQEHEGRKADFMGQFGVFDFGYKTKRSSTIKSTHAY